MIREQKVPLLMILSENDKLVDTDISYEIAALLGAKEESFSRYEPKTNCIGVARTTREHPWVLVLPEGGHLSFKKNPTVVNEAISEFASSIGILPAAASPLSP